MIRGKSGLTFVELLMAVTLLGIMALAFFSITHATFQTTSYAGDRGDVNETGRVALERMADSIRRTHRLLLPFERAALDTSVSHALCVANGGDDDGDGRVDEDSYDVYQDGVAAGIPGVDDDGDGFVDEGSPWDDDEDGVYDEDPLDGKDNDGDGRIDEDWGFDMNGDGASGVIWIDDDEDGWVDEHGSSDDDEDGRSNEDAIGPVAYYVETTQLPPSLIEIHPTEGKTTLATNLYYENTGNRDQGFTVTRIRLVNGTTLVQMDLLLRTETGETLEFRTTVIAQNCERRPAWQEPASEIPS